VVTALLFLAACSQGMPKVSGSIVKAPRSLHPAQLTEPVARGEYWEVDLGAVASGYRGYLPDTQPCSSLLDTNADEVEFSRLGIFGTLSRGQLSCPLTGTASLPQYRDDRGGSRATRPKRLTARFKLSYEDDDVLMARGLFPMVGLLGIRTADDIIAVAPATDECRTILSRGEALMSYRSRGAPVLVLTVSGVDCGLTGVIIPQRE
jgi:hypothetical protein